MFPFAVPFPNVDLETNVCIFIRNASSTPLAQRSDVHSLILDPANPLPRQLVRAMINRVSLLNFFSYFSVAKPKFTPAPPKCRYFPKCTDNNCPFTHPKVRNKFT